MRLSRAKLIVFEWKGQRPRGTRAELPDLMGAEDVVQCRLSGSVLHDRTEPVETGSQIALQNQLPDLFLVGVPGSIGGAATKVAHLIGLLQGIFSIKLVATDPWVLREKEVRRTLDRYGVPGLLLKEIPARATGVALAICDKNFFACERARSLKNRGLRVVWSNEMMWPFRGEEQAVKEGLVDRVLFVSQHQEAAFGEIYAGVPSFRTGNYIDPDDYRWKERIHATFTIGRLSRPDPQKYPLDFPIFYESLGLGDVRYRVMAWSPRLQQQYRWHKFDENWELVPEHKESALHFLYSLDALVYPIGHRIRESWGRAVVEAMLTGCVPVVPFGHQFHNFIAHGETGFICKGFREFRICVRELCENFPLRTKMARQGADYARNVLCNPEMHREVWVQALTF